jgi:hypothetical protein
MLLEHRYHLHVPIDWDGEYEVDGLDGSPKQGGFYLDDVVQTNPDANPAFRPTADVGVSQDEVLGYDAYGNLIMVGDQVTPANKPCFSSGYVNDYACRPEDFPQAFFDEDLGLHYTETVYYCDRVIRVRPGIAVPMQGSR